MFLLNFGALSPNAVFRDVAESTDGQLGACLLASGFDSGQLVRNELPAATPLLFDPQLYLAGIPGTDDDGRIWRLASHPWFGVENVVSFESDVQRKREWEADIKAAASKNWSSRLPPPSVDLSKAAIETQIAIGCSMVILPSPLLTAREDEAAPAVDWTRVGVAAAQKIGSTPPLLATVALDERVLNDAAFAPLGYLDAVVSQITACRGIHGVYIVIAQTGDPGHPYRTSELVHLAYASLCRRFREARRLSIVLPNFCDIGGLLCIAHGATGFATGNFVSVQGWG